MVQIFVDNKQIQLLQPIDELISIKIKNTPFPPALVQPNQGKQVMKWLYDLAQRATSIEYNGTILTKDQLNPPN